MRFKKYKVIAFLGSLLIIVGGCSNNDKVVEEYEYGLLFSSNNKSIISTYNESGEFVSDKSINESAITFASFMKDSVELEDKIYYAAPLVGTKPNNHIIEIDKNTLKERQIKSEEGITPTFFTVDKDYAFTGVSSLDESIIIKTDLHENKVIATTEINGQGINMIQEGEYIYILSIDHENPNNETKGYINILKKSNFEIVEKIEIKDLTFSTDMKKINEYIYLLVTHDGNDKLSNKMLKINVKNKETEIIDIPFDNLSSIHVEDEYLYVTECNFHSEETQKRVAKLNMKDNSMDEFVTYGEIISSIISEDKLITSDGVNIYIYNIDTFELEDKFDVKEYNSKIFVSIFNK